MNVFDLTPTQLRQAAALKERIAQLQKELSSILGSATPATAAPQKKQRAMSAAGLASIRAAQKARWAKVKGTAKPATAPAPAKKKFTMSASAKAAISKAAKARWAKIRAAKQK